jgi:hypothetical protein
MLRAAIASLTLFFAGSLLSGVRALTLVIACGALLYYVVATLAALRFFSRQRKKKLG